MLRPAPTWQVGTVLELPPEWFQSQGLKGLLLDLDETLCPAGAPHVAQPFVDWLAAVQAAGLRLGVVSNNTKPDRVRVATEPLALPWRARAMKPFAGGFRSMLAELKLQPEEVAVVGDQLYTDILGGAWLGARTILVRPMEAEHKAWRKWMRKVEAWALNDGHWPLAKA